MKSFEFEIKPAAPFDFSMSLRFYSRSKFEEVDVVRDGVYNRLLRIADSICRIKVRDEGDTDNPRMHVHADCENLDRNIRERIIDTVKNIFRTEFDLSGFYKFCRREKHLKRLTERFYGLKNLQSSNPFEIMVWAITGQQVSLDFAYILKKRLVETFGKCYNRDGVDLYLFPDPGTLAGLEIENLREMQFSRNKAEYITGLAKSVNRGEINLENLNEFDDNSLRNRLTAVHGIGRWSSEYVMLRALGRDDACPSGDAGLRRALAGFYGLNPRAGEKEIDAFMERFRPYRGLATYYFWFSLPANKD